MGPTHAKTGAVSAGKTPQKPAKRIVRAKIWGTVLGLMVSPRLSVSGRKNSMGGRGLVGRSYGRWVKGLWQIGVLGGT